ncbi:MAG TPA: glycosyltransferase [Pirellulales bacterium]|nr:glycosyltransferase [Pirellulales bacterium]
MASLLYLAPVDWTSIRQRPQQLALRLARKHDLAYVNPVGLRSARFSDLRRLADPIAGARLRRRSDSLAVDDASAAPQIEMGPPFPVLNPRYMPFVGWRALDAWNRRWLFRQLEPRLAGGPVVLWIGAPSLLAETLLERTQPQLVVYDCMDRYAAFHRGRTRARIDRVERAIVERADLVFATSQGLVERLQPFASAVELLPNGVDFARFAIARSAEPPDWRRKIAGPVVGYHGALGDWLDYEMLAWLAQRRRDWSFVVIGPNGSRRSRVFLSQPNVHYLGPLPYAELPGHTVWFDAGLVPFEQNDLTRCVHPIKALEYLAAGLPTVSTALADLADLAGHVRFADTPYEWLSAIEDCLEPAARSAELVAARRGAVAGRTWHRLGETVAARLAAALAAGATTPQQRSSLLKPSAKRAA